MGKFNTYRYLVLEDTDDFKKVRRRRKSGKFQRLFVISLVISFIVFIGFYATLFHPIIEYVVGKLGLTDSMYAVILDTDSSRSELYIYKFHKYVYRSDVSLDREVIIKQRPGLASSIYDSNKGEQLHNLLKEACSSILFDKSIVTPFILKFTSVPSYLPLINVYHINKVIRRYYDYISSIGSPFFMKQEYFSILKRPEESLDYWTTVNYLLDNYHKLTVLHMDDDSLHTIIEIDSKDIKKNNYTIYRSAGLKGKVPLFIKSFPNLGLMATRLGVMQIENPGFTVHFNSSCINPIIKDQPWRYGQKEYFISGPTTPEYIRINGSPISVSRRDPVVNSTKCLELIIRYVNRNMETLGIPKMSSEQKLYFFGHFFDQASDVGLIDPIKGGKLSMSSLTKIRSTECNFPNVDQPWACFDLIYIYVLLKRLFGRDINYELATKINEHRVAWALGAAYNLLNGLIETEL